MGLNRVPKLDLFLVYLTLGRSNSLSNYYLSLHPIVGELFHEILNCLQNGIEEQAKLYIYSDPNLKF
jgi:hypothetical protein